MIVTSSSGYMDRGLLRPSSKMYLYRKSGVSWGTLFVVIKREKVSTPLIACLSFVAALLYSGPSD